MSLAIDLARGAQAWTPMEQDLYNQLPIYLAEQQVKYQQLYDRWGKFLTPFRWKPNSGHLLRGVRKERSPIIRSQALPNTMQQNPKKDVLQVREVTNDAQLYRHDFRSKLFHFLPTFADFLNDHVDATERNMVEKIMVYKDLFYRTAIFHGAPYVWVCGAANPLQPTAHWLNQNIALTKDSTILQNLSSQATKGLTLQQLKLIGTVMYNDIGATPFTGEVRPDGSDGSGLAQKFGLLCGTEVWDSFTDDEANSYLLNHKSLDLNIVTGAFTGSLFGRFTTLFERFEMRIKADGTVPQPETIQENSAAYNYGETVPFPDYIDSSTAVAYAIGGEAYKALSVGPPPSLFAKGASGMTMEKFAGMDWSGKIRHTRNVLVPSDDGDGNTILDTNSTGEWLRLEAEVTMGILPQYRRNILPIIYKRTRQAA